ncbi:MAG: C4-dicarboxylate ABC transporter [Bdellovibrionales bacterium RIFOXYC1_FULL_54_43]|nr:MAG: C4-dicarboxylate ABC transporter [Bdellovibrionales bacterium RIFOXYC1_FULL_54_43]OFZ83419.1 MAG: C4-dicarboxylate ABC transporter [Bdellovibrionales bacterium RIFOXYD1_FULL_55_31]
MGTLVTVVIIAMALLGAPLFAVFAAAALALFYFDGTAITAVIIEMYRISTIPLLITIPLFTFAGYLLAESKAPHRIVRFSQALVGWMPGGLAIVALVVCAFFTAFTGASGVTIIAIGGLMMPVLIADGYKEKFAIGLLTTSGSLGLLFPPSLPIIIYGLVSGASIDQLFIAGLLPGLFIVFLLSLYAVFTAKRAHLPTREFSMKELLDATREFAWELPLPILVVGGIYSGIFTATEAAAITAFYAFVVEVFIYRDLHLIRDVPRVMRESMILVGAILIILGAVLGFTNYVVDAQIPIKALEWIRQYMSSKIVFLMLLNVVLLIGGALLDMLSALMLVPLVLPIAKEFGVDPIHLGIIYLANLEIGYSTPPAGLNLFIGSFRFKRPIVNLYGASLPFLSFYVVALGVITYWPDLSLVLLRYFGGK